MTVSAKVLYAAVLRMGSVVEAIVEETAAVALEICKWVVDFDDKSIRNLRTQANAYRASEFALFHRLECFGDRIADFDPAFFEFLRGSP
jgi:hypothetical protein